jgi:anti-sigma regulatory factor (Ser/Thr protein kinase)
MTRDEIILTLPRERPFFGVAHLVVGGLAVRLDLSYDELDDLQIALAELLGYRDLDDSVTLAVRVEGDTFAATIGPFDERVVKQLTDDDANEVGLRRVLETVVDAIEVTQREGKPWVELRKSIQRSGVAL